MSRFCRADIVRELTELSHELIDEVRHQLQYYRASVYKHETAGQIEKSLTNLRMITAVIGDDMLLEPFKDYEATAVNGNFAFPGECSFSFRVGRLTTALQQALEAKLATLAGQWTSQDGGELAARVKRHQRELLVLCQPGTRQWSFFKSL